MEDVPQRPGRCGEHRRRLTVRVLMLSSNWPPAAGGGAEAYAVRLTDELRRRDHDVGVVTLGVEGTDVVGTVSPRPHRLAQHRSTTRVARARFHLADLTRRDVDEAIRAAIEDFRPDVVHSHVVAGMSLRALTCAGRVGVPQIHTLHDHWLRCWRSTGTSRTMGPCGPGCAALAQARGRALREAGPAVFVAISQAIADAHTHLPAERIEVVLHPSDVDPRPRDPRPTGPVTFGFLGVLGPNKGVRTLLAAAGQLAPGTRVVFGGTGPLIHEVTHSGIEGVEAWGWVGGERREEFFSAIDCLVVPSVWPEPAGLVVREAAARGIPIIASCAGGLPEYVPTSCSPLLHPPGDATALTERMRRFADEPEAYAVDPAEIPVWDDHLARVLALYRRVVRSRPLVP